ncbi:MAG: dihydropteroate synthase [Actinomycetota bacterium]|nr:dihydropteroate synthase [Actinomycetota bacterium]
MGPAEPLLMGVLNVSPESFSDGSDATTIEDSVVRGRVLLADGAHLLDIGGESAVTNQAAVSAEEEIRRVVPVVTELVAQGAAVSVDTWKRPVAQAVLDAGAHLINDVSGLRDPGIAEDCAAFGAGLVVMHTRAAPKHKELPAYHDVVDDVVAFVAERIEVALSRGMELDQLIIDPGPDFAKTPAQTIAVLQHLDRLQVFDRPILLALSRKDFVGALTARMPRQRSAGTLAAVGYGLDRGGSIVRVHDVAQVVDYLRVRAALRGHLPIPPDLHLAEELRRERSPRR